MLVNTHLLAPCLLLETVKLLLTLRLCERPATQQKDVIVLAVHHVIVLAVHHVVPCTMMTWRKVGECQSLKTQTS